MSFAKEDRNNRFELGRTVPAARFVTEIAAALRRQYGDSRSAVKTIVSVTGANERAVKNWFSGKNGPSGAFLIELCRHSDQVLDTVLLLAGRTQQLRAKKFGELRDTFRRMIVLMSALEDDVEHPEV